MIRGYLLIIGVFISSFCFGQKAKPKQTDNTQPFVLGVIDALQSKELGEKRVLNIYLPEGYSKTDTTRYPIVYLLDGSADEDFIHVVGLYQFNSFSWIMQVPKSIVVGIATVDRRRDFTYPTTIQHDREKYPTTGHSDKFMAFLENELQPFIEKKYKGNGDRTIIGQSLGGLVAAEILLKKPSLFNRYFIVSPSLWWDNGSLLDYQSPQLNSSFAQKTDVYIAVGREGLTPTKVPRMMVVDADLLAEKIRAAKAKALQVYFDYLPQEDHATILHQAIFNAMRTVYPKPVITY